MDIQGMSAEQISDLAADLAAKAIEVRKAEQEEARKRRQAARAAEHAAHYARMYDEVGQPLADLNEAQHGLVYALAYEQGHASGYEEVESYYGDLAELVRAVIAAA